MSVIIPHIPIVAAMHSDLLRQVKNIFDESAKTGRLDGQALWEHIKAVPSQLLVPLHDPKNPLIKDVEGQQMMVMAWAPRENLLASDFTLAILFKRQITRDNQDAFVPETVLRGSKANVLIFGGMSCCGETLQAHWTHITPSIAIDASRVPLSALPHPTHAHWLRGKVRLLDTQNDPQARAHIDFLVRDILSHRDPSRVDLKPSGQGGDYTSLKAAAPTGP